MALGTIDSINYLKNGIENGTINVVETANGWQVSGDTYQVKEYLKRDFAARWDKDAQAWSIAIDDHYEGGRDSYHYGIFADACKPKQPEHEQPETAEDETTTYEIDVCKMQATFADGVWHIEPKSANGSFEPVEHIELTESDIANGYAERAVDVVAHTQQTEEINVYGDFIEFRSVVLYSRTYDADGQLIDEESIYDKWCLSDAARNAIFLNKAL